VWRFFEVSRTSVLLGCRDVIWQGRKALLLASVVFSPFTGSQYPVLAQSNLVPDNTLGSEASRVIFNSFNTPNEAIEGGAQRGQNLFHSFREFNVNENRGVYFHVLDPSIQNIFARVTGSNRSDIFGTLGTRQLIDGNLFRSNANLFLMNPNGIIFGGNARLDVGASFMATTANGVQFGESGSFNASGNQPSQVLTINPSAFFFNQINAAPIVNQSISTNFIDPSFIDGLSVNDGRSLLLLGGSVNLDGGALGAYDGRIELGGLAGIGTVGLNVDGNNLDLNFPTDVAKADISFSNRSSVNTSGIGGGEIQVHGNNVTLSGKSGISSNTFGNQNGKGIFIEAKQLVLNDSGIFTRTNTPANSGDITINSQSLNLQNGALVLTDTAGEGKAGNLTVTARDSINITGVNALLSNPVLPSILLSFTIGSGAAGDIRIVDTGRINIEDGGKILANTGGQGRAGNIDITADNVQLVGTSANQQFRSAIASESTGNFASSNSGDITIKTRLLSVRDGAAISTRSSDQGKAGNLTVKASESLKINGTGVHNNEVVSSILSTQALSFGAAGNIEIFDTKLVEIKDGGKISTSTSGQGRGGNMDITADTIELKGVAAQGLFRSSLESRTTGNGSSARAGDITLKTRILNVTDAALISTTTFNSGQGGDINLTAQESMVFSGTGTFFDGQTIRSGLSLQTNNSGTGGNLKIFNTGAVRVQNGALISTITSGEGDSGNIDIDADTVDLIGISDNNQFNSTFASETSGKDSIANAGDITVTSRILNIRDGADISTRTFNQGKGGNLTINARESLNIFGTGTQNGLVFSSGLLTSTSGLGGSVFSDVQLAGQGNGGDINIQAGSLSVTGGAQLQTGTRNRGNAGNIFINTRNFVLDNSQLRASTQGEGDAGNIFISAYDRVSLDKGAIISNIVGDISNPGRVGNGKGGLIRIDTGSLSVANGSQLQASTFGVGDAGDIIINAHENVSFDGFISLPNNIFYSAAFSIVAGNSTGNGGNIRVNTKSLSITNGALFSTSTFGQGRAGNISIDARKLDVSDRAQISVNSQGSGVAGDINIDAKRIELRDNAKIIAETASQDGGNIFVDNADLLLLRRGSVVSATAGEAGNGGNVNINSKFIIAIPKENSDITANAFEGNGGRVQINTQGIFGTEFRSQETNQSDITASSRFGVSGIVTIESPDNSSIQNNLGKLPQAAIDTNALIANSCIARRNQQQNGSFFITGSGGLPLRPGDASLPSYSTGDVQPIPTESTILPTQTRPWQIGDRVIEPTGVYELPNGKLVLGKEC
jgi:filamentous hemagglutinin family protein